MDHDVSARDGRWEPLLGALYIFGYHHHILAAAAAAAPVHTLNFAHIGHIPAVDSGHIDFDSDHIDLVLTFDFVRAFDFDLDLSALSPARQAALEVVVAGLPMDQVVRFHRCLVVQRTTLHHFETMNIQDR